MAVYSGVKLEGGRTLRRTLRKAGADLEDMKAAHREAAEIVADQARRWAPKVSGKLSHTIRPGATTTASIVRAGNNRTTASGVPYANPIHWGWKRRGIRPNPFLSYSAQATEKKWLPLMIVAVDNAIDQVKGI